MNRKSQTRLIYGFIFGVILISVFSLYFIGADDPDENTKSDLIFGENISNYGMIEIKNQSNNVIASLELKKNTDTCGFDCSAELEIIMYQDGILIDDIKFLEKQYDGTWIEKPIKNYQFYLKMSGSQWLIDDYVNECELSGTYYPNGTEIKTCSKIKSGSHYEDNYTYEKYELGTKVKAGTYYVKLNGERDNPKWVDWQITTQEILLEDFYVCGGYVEFIDISGTESYPQGIGTNGSVILIGHDSTTLYVFDMSGNYIKTWDLGGQLEVLSSTWNGTNWFVMSAGIHGSGARGIYEYDASYNFVSSCTVAGLYNWNGITTNGTNMWITQIGGTQAIKELDMNCNVIKTITPFTMNPGSGILYSTSDYVTYNNSNIFLLESLAVVSVLDLAGAKTGQNFSLNTGNTNPWALTGFREYFYVADGTDGGIYVYYNAPVTLPVSVVTTTLNSPVDYYNSSSNLITFNCSANTTSLNGEVLTNISLWLNTTGAWLLNETKDVSGTYNNSIFTKNIPDGINLGWTCKAYDNSSASSWGINRTFSVNSPPTHNPPLLKTLTGKNLSTEDLTCYNQSTYDVDNDAVTNIYNWYKNNQPLMVLNLPFEINANDYSNNNNHGTIYGTTFEASKTEGKVGNALSFDGIDDYVTTVDINKAEGTNALTTEAWIMPKARASGVTNPMIIAKYYAWNLHINYNNNGFVFSFNDGSGWATDSVTYSAQLMQNTWYYVVGRYDGSTCKIFVNGNEVASASCNENITTNTNAVKIGQWNNNEWFNGTIDEVRIYSYALSAEQIKQRYEETKDGLTTSSTIVSQETSAGDNYMCQVTPNDGEEDGVTLNSTSLSVLWAITFNVTNGEDGSQITSLDNIICNNSWSSGSVSLPFEFGFEPGGYECTFVETWPFEYFNKTIIFNANEDKVIDIVMSKKAYLTIEEHTWLEWLYNCWHNGNCWDLLENINQTTTQTWQRLTGTNLDVITQEQVLSYELSTSSNITINYTIDLPYKEGVAVNELLPIRLYFWFTDTERTQCYSQDKGTNTNRAEAPYCLPLVAEILGPNDGTVSFQVDLRPALPVGIYNFTRSVEIDPFGIWTQYGREDIGQIEITESGDASIDVSDENKVNKPINLGPGNSNSGGSSNEGGTTTIIKEKEIIKLIPEEKPKDDEEIISLNKPITGATVGASLLSRNNLMFIVTILCITFIIFLVVTSRTILKLKNK